MTVEQDRKNEQVSPESGIGKLETKIARVREALQDNPDVYFAGEVHKYNSCAPEGRNWTETVDVIVAPNKPTFDAGELNKFMKGLVPGLKPTTLDEARVSFDYFSLGRLYFDEVIGVLRKITVIETTEPETLTKAGRAIGEAIEDEKKIMRRTWVRVYPDITSAQAVYEYEDAYSTKGSYIRDIAKKMGTERYDLARLSKHNILHERLEQLKAQYEQPQAS